MEKILPRQTCMKGFWMKLHTLVVEKVKIACWFLLFNDINYIRRLAKWKLKF